MLTIDQKKEILSKVENLLNTYNDSDFTECNISINLNDAADFADKVGLVRTLYELSYIFRGENGEV